MSWLLCRFIRQAWVVLKARALTRPCRSPNTSPEASLCVWAKPLRGRYEFLSENTVWRGAGGLVVGLCSADSEGTDHAGLQGRGPRRAGHWHDGSPHLHPERRQGALVRGDFSRIRRSGRVLSEKIGCSIEAMSSLGIASSTSQIKKSAVGWRSGKSGGRVGPTCPPPACPVVS